MRWHCTISSLIKGALAGRHFEVECEIRHCLLGLMLLLSLVGCESAPETLSIEGPTMGTRYHIKWVPTVKVPSSKVLQSKVDEVLEQVNAQMSTYRPDSELSQLNQDSLGRWHQVSKPLSQLLQQSLDLYVLTGGSFDVTVGPLVNLWGFGPEPDPTKLPSDADIELAKQKTGVQAIEIQGDKVRWSKPRYVDLSAIAKGYGVDAVAALLDQEGIKHYLVEIGGEIYARGQKAEGQPWKVAVETPSYHQRGIFEVLPIYNQGMATSGDYRNYQEFEGERYSHTLDPRTGRPISHQLASVTVVADNTARADALATAILVMGETEGFAFAKGQHLAALLIVRAENGFKEISTPAYQALKSR
jgi:thiamine biosynthesis lipoprotein